MAIIKKVAISTIFYICNYGTVLQAYATQKILTQLGYSSEIIHYIPERASYNRLLLKSGDTNSLNRLINILSIIFRLPLNLLFLINFKRFTRKNLIFTKRKYKNTTQVMLNPPLADIYMTGSDQVWNSNYNEGIDSVYYLQFVPDSMKKISYASSIGADDFRTEEKIAIKKLLEKYDNISVREQSAKEAVNNLGITNVQQVLDPTLLLGLKSWKKIMSKRKIKQKYLLLYILGRDKEILETGKRIAKERNLKIVKIGLDFILSPKVCKNDFLCNPSEYLSYFYYADYVITNSFHGLAFSIYFNKQFSVILPKSYSTRLESIVNQFNLCDRIIRSEEDLEKQKEFIDYKAVNKELNRAKKASLHYLKKALENGNRAT